jgi:hypothetical protein
MTPSFTTSNAQKQDAWLLGSECSAESTAHEISFFFWHSHFQDENEVPINLEPPM